MSGHNSDKWKKPALVLMLATGIMSLLGHTAVAQNAESLNLFEPVERQAAPEPQQIQQSPSVQVATSSAEPFTMIGTSRLGDRWRARVRSPSGQILTVDLDPKMPVTIPGFPGYTIAAASTRELVINHPASSPCVPRSDKGVNCTNVSEARLSIATASPLAPAPQQAAQFETAATSGAEATVTEVSPDNPFAAALRAARERAEAEGMPVQMMEGERFRPRRIDPSEVPPGSRLIRTPFGDRIITE
ncbi:MAG: hypothetical protein Q7L07_17310 [Pseudohongiella sp.]|nr:hypothetical protein [Pseudohongiella sp.]